jgi:hypothetical protein
MRVLRSHILLKYTKLQYSPFQEHMACVEGVLLEVPSMVY